MSNTSNNTKTRENITNQLSEKENKDSRNNSRGNTRTNTRTNTRNKAGNRTKNTYANKTEPKGFNYTLLPIIFVVTILPLIVKMTYYDPKLSQFTWFPNSTQQLDFFLYYRHWSFVVVSAIALGIITLRRFYLNKPLKFSAELVPLGIYALLALLSAIFSDYAYHSFHGSIDQLESVWALLGYCLIVYYAVLYIDTESDLKMIIHALFVGAIIIGFIGLTQFIGQDFFGTRIGTRLITSAEYVNDYGKLKFNFEKGRVYLTLFNPNYVGVYVSLVAPIFLILLLFSKKIISSVFYLIALVGLIVCAIGSRSLSGMVGLAVAVFGILIFLWRYLLKRYYITIPVFLILATALFIFNMKTDNIMLNRVKGILNIEKHVPDLESIITGEDKVTIKYKGNELNIALIKNSDSAFSFHLTDHGNKSVEYKLNDKNGYYVIQDERFKGISFIQLADMDYQSFLVKMIKQDWVFTNNYGDGTYYYYNRYNKWDKIDNPPKTFLSDYGFMASRRGYIWDRTIPLLKDNILLGTGPDTYTMAFPQRDYVGFVNYHYFSQLMTKPHNMYLQTAVQTGVLSLIAFLVFYGMYFVSSFCLYIKGRFNSLYAQVGVAIFIGSMAYMVTGLTNDSSITTAPIFWTLMGVGIAVNHKAKPLIQKEIEENRVNKSVSNLH